MRREHKRCGARSEGKVMRSKLALLSFLALAGCATAPTPTRLATPERPIEVQILAFNDFHGNIETPPAVEVTEANGMPP